MKTLKSPKVAHYTLRNKKNRSVHNSFDQFDVTIYPQLIRSTVALERWEHLHLQLKGLTFQKERSITAHS